MDKRALPDTPWHVGYTKKEEADPRRHKGRCIYLEEGVCHCGESGAFTLKCPGSSHCTSYAENLEQDKRNKERHKSIEVECWERADKYKKNMRQRCENSMQNEKMKYWHKNILLMSDCPFCGERFHKGKNRNNQYRICEYCGAVYHIVDSEKSAAIDVQEFLVKRK